MIIVIATAIAAVLATLKLADIITTFLSHSIASIEDNWCRTNRHQPHRSRHERNYLNIRAKAINNTRNYVLAIERKNAKNRD